MSRIEPLLEPSFLRRLDALRLAPRRPMHGAMSGNRRSMRRGVSAEFADFREYAPGDDLRSVDWNIYGRLNKLFLKLFVDEEDLSLHLLLDTSGSMAFGAPLSKVLYAKKLAAALGYVALAQADRVSVAALGEMPGTPLHGLYGRVGIGPLFTSLQQMPTQGGTSLTPPLTRYAAQARNPGIAVVLSDFLDEAWADGLAALRARRFQIVLVHLLSPEEEAPSLSGEVRLLDAETGEVRDISLSPLLLSAYRDRLQEHCAGLERAATRYDMRYVRFVTTLPLDHAVRRLLESGGFLR